MASLQYAFYLTRTISMLQQRKYQRTIMPYSCQHITVVYVGKACGFDYASE